MRLYQMYSPITATPYRRDKTYVEVAPCKELAPYIKCFWGSDIPYEEDLQTSGTPQIIIPDTCMDIIFSLNYTDNKINSSFIGINDDSFSVFEGNSKKTVSTFAIRFYPWSTYLFSEDSLLNTKNQAMDLEYHFADLKREMEPVLFGISAMSQRVAFAERYLLKRLNMGRINNDMMNALYRIIKQRGKVEISTLAKELHISSRQLERIFAANIGLSPKKISSLIRYQFLWNEILNNTNFNIQDAVYRYGFTDQSHLLHEFKRYHSLPISEAKQNALNHVAIIQE